MTLGDPYAPQPVQDPKKFKIWPWVLGLVGLFVVVLCGLGVYATGNALDNVPDPTKTTHSVKQPGVAAVSQPPAASHNPLTAKDIALTVKITEKDCYTVLKECSVVFQIVATTDLDKLRIADRDYEVTYDVKGLDSDKSGSLTFHPDGTYEQDPYQYGQTKTLKPKLTAVVTGVEEQV